jgi:NIMA (never in mitosis gene a)-related kinase
MEFADSGDLFQKILDSQKKGGLIPENEIWSMIIQVY